MFTNTKQKYRPESEASRPASACGLTIHPMS